MEQLTNQDFSLEKIKIKLLEAYKKYNSVNIPYTEAEIITATRQLQLFFTKLNNLIIYDGNTPRKPNNLELFTSIYEFVANRVYVDQRTSHDLIGTLISNKGVCQGYCQLMSFICDFLNIPFLYKKVQVYDENKNPVDSHGNFEVIIQDETGFNHCLYCDPTIDSPKYENDILSFNGFLIQDNDVNRYYHKQFPSAANIFSFYENFLSKQDFERSIDLLKQVNQIEQIFSGKSDEEIISDHFNTLRGKLVELNYFFRMNIDFNSLDNLQLITAYRMMYEYYCNISQPFESEILKQAIKNIKTAEIMYDAQLDFSTASIQSEKIYEKRMNKSIEQQEKYWENDGGVSLMFTELKKVNTTSIK